VPEVIVPIAVVLLLALGFWWTRGAGGIPGGTNNPAREELRRFTELGDPAPRAGAEPEDREHQVE
jgi:hypothetical protein